MEFLIVVEAKKHRYPIKRELVQVLHSKIQSVGAHKGVMVSTAPYQNGALDSATADLSEVMRYQPGSDPPDAFDTGS